ncbi:hypothetical protein TSUD_250080 [Trifolium subterraneum]|nr:hypothetical protein TSUD_250080 [Trifolium subterraneum]
MDNPRNDQQDVVSNNIVINVAFEEGSVSTDPRSHDEVMDHLEEYEKELHKASSYEKVFHSAWKEEF